MRALLAKLHGARLRTKALVAGVATCAVFIVCAAVTVTTLSNLTNLSNQSKEANSVERTVAAAYEQWTLDDDQSNMYAAVVALRDPSQNQLAETTWQQVLAAHHAATVDLASLSPAALTPGARTVLRRINADLASYNGFTRQLGQYGHAGKVQQAVYVMTVANLKPSNDLPIAFAKLDAIQRSQADAAAAELRSNASSGELLITVLAVVGALLAAGIMAWLARSALGPLAALRRRLDDIAEGEGDLTARADDSRHDEFSEVAKAFNRFVARIQAVMTKVGGSTAALRQAVERLESAASDMGAGAEQTTQQAQTVATASSQISDGMGTVAASAEEMSASIDEIARSAARAAEVAADAVAEARRADVTVTALGDASAEITRILDMISGVAEQTKLLALNATIEAARAGEAGKGFAVVADEVKTLASNTASAADDIGRRIDAMSDSTRSAVAAITRIGEVVGTLDELSSTIASAVEEQTATTGELTRTVGSAAASSGDIAGSVATVAAAAEQTLGGVSATRESAQTLAGLAGQLDELVGSFRY